MLTRALFVLLLVLNAGVAAWWAVHTPAAEPTAPAVPADVPALELIGSVAPPSGPMRHAASSSAAPQGDLRCWRYGPFSDATALAAAQRAISADVAWSAIAEQPLSPPRAWRVVLPQPDRATANATSARIGAAGFSDYLVLPDGGVDANTIALGRYRSEASARERAAALARAGFDAVAEPVGGRMVRWLDVAAPASYAPQSAKLGLAGAPLDCAGVPRGGRYTIPGPA